MADEDQINEGEGTAKPAGKSKKLLIIAAAVLILLLGGGATWFFVLSPSNGEPKPVSLGPVQYLEISPSFIVNFPYQGRQRFLQANVTVMARDAAALAAVSEHMPAIRHNLNTLFSAQMLNVVDQPSSGIERLRALATEEIQAILQEEIGRDGIEEVLFTSFVLQ
ncbi:MAG: flagellar basal body-associated FliL family protein [Pseudohongiellaceae bacterium]|nr:flagellar basal body-associated FliL family protein [Pseudohongiellaceae bacterium]